LNSFSFSARHRHVEVQHLDQIGVDAARPGRVGRVVEQHDVVDARHPHLAHALVPLDHERIAAEALRGREYATPAEAATDI
jgi:hypothetical protein